MMHPCARDEGSNPIDTALKNYQNVRTYKVTLRSSGNHFAEEIRYYYKSGHVRMEFVKPLPGAILTYDQEKQEVRFRPLGILNHVVTLAPDNNLIQSSAGHRVDESDIGSLLRVVVKLQSIGMTNIVGEDILSGRQTIRVRVTGNENCSVRGVHKYDLWLDAETCLPLKMVAYDSGEGVIEEILMDDLEVNPDLTDDLFLL